MAESWPFKDPEEILDYRMDWTDRLEDSETITVSVWEVIEGSVEMEASPAPSIAGSTTKVWLSGGTLGETCIVTNHITTSTGREREFSGKLKIKAK